MSILKVDTINEKTSGNGVVIPGHVVQVQETSALTSGNLEISSSSLTATGIICSITPQKNDSIILIDWFVSMADHSTSYGYGKMYLKVGSGSYAAMAGSDDYTAGYKNSSYNRYAPIGMSGKYQVTSTDTLSFQPYYLANSGYIRVVHTKSSYCLRLTEIAQ